MPSEPLSTYGKRKMLLICGFFGFLGIHRFLLGYPGLGTFYLLTFGGCGVLYAVDFFRILSGSLKMADGRELSEPKE